MTSRAYELTHTDGAMNPAPDWAHRLLDLTFGGWQIMPTGGIHMAQASVPGQMYSSWSEYGKELFTVDFRKHKNGVWTVNIEQPQPEPVPPKTLSVDEWLTDWKKGKK